MSALFFCPASRGPARLPIHGGPCWDRKVAGPLAGTPTRTVRHLDLRSRVVISSETQGKAMPFDSEYVSAAEKALENALQRLGIQSPEPTGPSRKRAQDFADHSNERRWDPHRRRTGCALPPDQRCASRVFSNRRR